MPQDDYKTADIYECKESKVENKQRGGKTTTCIFFDYDDTLLASSFLWNLGLRLDSDFDETHQEILKNLRDLEIAVSKVLTRAASFGTVCIVTNAESGWVERSAEKFMPNVAPLLSKLQILSARTMYEVKHPDKPVEWKVCAFQSALKTFVSTGSFDKSHVISFGDSNVEREAVRTAAGSLMNNRTKTVKFAEHPTIEQLKRQLELVHNCIHYLCSHDGDLDLQLTVSPLPPTTASSPKPTTPAATEVPKINSTTASSCGAEHANALPTLPTMPVAHTAQGS